jgi:tetratricopeptide (TPR) repeat protein
VDFYAAFHLAKIYLNDSAKNAQKYIEKILQKDPAYFAKHFKQSKDMMYEFASREKYDIASKIAKAILDGINPTYDEYEEILKDWGLWLSKTEHKKEAIDALNKYLKAFPDGDYIQAVQIAKDKLFFVVDDLNTTQKLNNYNKLIEEYANDTIGQKALYEKAKLLLKLKEFKKVLQLQDALEKLDTQEYDDVDTIIKKAAMGMMYEALEKKNCKAVLDISQTYKIKLSNEWDDEVYDCAMKGGDFNLSKAIAMKHLKSKNIDQRKEWLYRYAKIDFATGNYSEMVDVAQDLVALINDEKSSHYKEIYRYLFDAYERLGNEQGMLDAMVMIEKLYGLNYKDLDRYVSMVSLGEKKGDANMVIKYGEKVMQIQNKADAYPQSPYVEFALYEAYKKKSQYQKALQAIRSLDKRQLTKKQRTRQKYLLGTVLDTLGKKEEAKQAYKASIKADKGSAWAQLAQTALEL